MNNIEINLKYRNKYLKYKFKYLYLKNQIGSGDDDFNKELNKCTITYPKDYTHYVAATHKCCRNKSHSDCKQMHYTINIASENLDISNNEFDISNSYIGSNNKILYVPKPKNEKRSSVLIINASTPHVISSISNSYIGSNNKVLYAPKPENEKRLSVSLINPITPNLPSPISYHDTFTKTNHTGKIETFASPEIIGDGKFGVVVKYKSENNNYIAVKYGQLTDIEKEKEIIQQLINYGSQCHDLIVKHVVNDDCIIMENAAGTIKNIRDAIHNENMKIKDINIIVDILYAILIAIKCLYDNSLYYTDIKMENILYRNTKNGIQIILGDLGSISPKDNPITTATYYPYEYIINKYTKDSTISWGIGILILDLLKINHDALNYSKLNALIEEINENTLKEYINKNVTSILTSIFNRYYYEYIRYHLTPIPKQDVRTREKILRALMNIINNTLCDIDKRWKIDQIISEINKLRLYQKKKNSLWTKFRNKIKKKK